MTPDRKKEDSQETRGTSEFIITVNDDKYVVGSESEARNDKSEGLNPGLEDCAVGTNARNSQIHCRCG